MTRATDCCAKSNALPRLPAPDVAVATAGSIYNTSDAVATAPSDLNTSANVAGSSCLTSACASSSLLLGSAPRLNRLLLSAHGTYCLLTPFQ